MKKEKITHKDRIFTHLRDFGSITSFECSENRYGDPVHYARYTLEVGV